MDTTNQLVTNEINKNFLTTLTENLSTCTEFKICVSFIRISGVQLLMDLLKELNAKGVKGQILASTYINVTQPKALEMLNSFENIQLKIFTSTSDQGFHAKGYLFLNPMEGESLPLAPKPSRFENDSSKLDHSLRFVGLSATPSSGEIPATPPKEKWTIIIGSSNISGAAFKKNTKKYLVLKRKFNSGLSI